MNLSEREKFERWVLAPIKALKALPNGDGAFAVLSICCGLYERFIDTKLKHGGSKASPENFRDAAARDLACDEQAIQRFWDGYRLGMQHAFHPKSYIQDKGEGDCWGWEIASTKGFHHYPEIIKTSEKAYIVRIDPWKFADHVIRRWEENFEMINGLSEFVLGNVSTVLPRTTTANVYDPARPDMSKYKTHYDGPRFDPPTGTWTNPGSTRG